MDGNKVLGAITIVLKKDIQSVGLGSHGDLIWGSMKRTLGIIRVEECGKHFMEISIFEFRAVRQILRHPDSKELLGDYPERVEGKILKQVFSELRNRSDQHCRLSSVAMAHAIWLRPYLYFRVGLLEGWGYFDELAVGED